MRPPTLRLNLNFVTGLAIVLLITEFAAGQSLPLAQTSQADTPGSDAATVCPNTHSDIMNTGNYRLLDYRRMFKTGRTPTPAELAGHWRGVNKGIVTLVGYRQFIKEFTPCGDVVIGDNLQVHQVSDEMLNCIGWQPKILPNGSIERRGKFVVKYESGRRRLIGRAFAHGATLSYRDGANRRRDPARFLVDKVVIIDEDHLLGRAVAKFGPLEIPLAFFVLERIR